MKEHSQCCNRRFLHFVAGTVLVLTLWRVWLGPVGILEKARAELPNPAVQRNEQLAEIRRGNALLAEIVQILKSQTLHVRLEGADN